MAPPAAPTAGPPARGAGAWIRAHKAAAGVGAAALLVVVYALIQRTRNKSAAAAATGTTSAIPAGTSTFADNQAGYDSLEAQITALQNQFAAQTTAPVGSPPAPGPSTTSVPPPRPAQPSALEPPAIPPARGVRVPSVVGQRANTAIGELVSSGFRWLSTTGDRNPAYTYVVSSQSPAPGSVVPAGSVVDVGFKHVWL